MSDIETTTPVQAGAPLPDQFFEGIPVAWHAAMRLANRIFRSPFIPDGLRGNADSVLACILAGQDLGIGPMVAFNSFHIIGGKASLKPEAMRGLVARAGHTITVLENTDDHVTLYGKRADNGAESTVTWSMADAERAGLLTTNKSWEKYPRSMLLARATSELCRQVFADTIGGYYTDTELEAIDALSYDVRDDPLHDPVPDLSSGSEEVAEAPEVPDHPGASASSENLELVPDERPHDDGLARRIHAEIASVFPGATQLERDRIRHALCMLITRGRDGGPVKSSNDLDMDEQLRLSKLLADVEAGVAHVTVGRSGPVVVVAGGKTATVTIDPPRVTIAESEQLTLSEEE